MIQDKLDFSQIDSTMIIRQNEIYGHTIPIDSGKYSDVGYRFRTNNFVRKDLVYPERPETELSFYDFKFFNQDTYDVDESNTNLAEIYFRFEVDEISHSREVYDVYAYLESMGGVPEILK